MYKRILCLVILSIYLLSISSCKAIQNSTINPTETDDTTTSNKENITFESLKNVSDACVIITTCVPEYYDVKTINDQIYTTVDFVPMEWQDKYYFKCPTLTIIENAKSYIEPESVYIVFLSKSEENDGYYLSYGKSSIFSVNSGDIKPLDYKMKNEVKTHWNNRIETFEMWFSENYEDPALTIGSTDNLSESSALSSEIS